MSKPRPIGLICKDLESLLPETLQEPEPVFQLADEVADHPDGIQTVELLLKLLERNQHLDWGVPGAVVHAVEKFSNRGYEDLLLASLRRAPTNHTVWMANRVINGVPPDEQERFLTALRNVKMRNDVTKEVRHRAHHFIDFQKSRA